ncbi:MAG TPA: GtrA family protein [Ktedonobacteraceae bacterium]
MVSLVQRLLKIRLFRYALVGGIGIFVNEGALFCFSHLFGLAIPEKSIFLYPISWFFAFEVSNIVNFTLNQFFTYREQVKDIHGWEWVRRAFKGQLTSISAMLISLAVSWTLFFLFHVDQYIASLIGIVMQFFYNFFISNKLVFRSSAQKPAELASTSPRAIEEMKATPFQEQPRVESTPK